MLEWYRCLVCFPISYVSGILLPGFYFGFFQVAYAELSPLIKAENKISALKPCIFAATILQGNATAVLFPADFLRCRRLLLPLGDQGWAGRQAGRVRQGGCLLAAAWLNKIADDHSNKDLLEMFAKTEHEGPGAGGWVPGPAFRLRPGW